jgi:hypothetical protein
MKAWQGLGTKDPAPSGTPQASAIQISDFRLRISEIKFFYNPHSAFGNPHFRDPRPS